MPQVQLNFSKITEQGLKPVTRRLEKAGLSIADVSATNKPRRDSGILVKSATIIFDSGQKIEIKIKQDGTVFQVRLNLRVIPIKHVDNLDKAVTEVAEAVNGNEKQFSKAKERKLKKLKIDPEKPRVTVSRKQKIEQASSLLIELKSKDTELTQQIESISGHVQTKKNHTEELEAKLATLKERGTELDSEFESLKLEINE